MAEFSSWDVIFGAGSSQLILGFEFPGLVHREAGFAELAGRIGVNYVFLRARPPDAQLCHHLSGDAYLGAWMSDLGEDRHRVRGVLGHGVGGVYAAAAAEEISRGQEAPQVILFDPQLPSPQLLGRELRREIAANSALLSDVELQDAGKVAAELANMAVEDIADTAFDMFGEYLDIISAAFERAGLGDARASSLMVPFESYMSWILAADQIDQNPSWERSTVIVSSDYPGPPGPGIRSAAGQADLLRSDIVAETVRGLLESQK